MDFIVPKDQWHRFANDQEAIEYAKKIGIAPKSCETNKKYIYVRSGFPYLCKIVGYVDEYTTVVSIRGHYHCIMPNCLVEMQTGECTRMVEYNEHTILSAPAYIALDFETTGLDAECCDIIEIGAVKVENGEEVAHFSSLVNPHYRIDPIITALTGITDMDLMAAPDLEEIAQEFVDFIGNLPIIAHNAKFDLKFLLASLGDILPKKIGYFDTMKYSREKCKGTKNHKLATLIEYYGLKVENTHRALDDARCLPKLLDALSGRLPKEDDEPAEATNEEISLFEDLKPIIAKELKARWMSPDRVYLRPTKGGCSICLGGDDNVIAKFKIRKKSQWFAVPDNCIKAVPKRMKPDDVKMAGFIRFSFEQWEKRLTNLFIHSLQLYFENYITDFSCCSSYKECSAAMKCLHPDDMFYLSCSYRKKIFHGISFYGKKEKSPGQPGLGD